MNAISFNELSPGFKLTRAFFYDEETAVRIRY